MIFGARLVIGQPQAGGVVTLPTGGAMTEAEINKLAADYIGFFVAGQAASDRQLRAVETVWTLCRDDAALAVRVIWVAVNLVEADNIRALAFLGTGPLEDLLNHHGAQVLGLLIEAARENPNLCVALSCVWRSSVDEETWGQLASALPSIRESHGRHAVN